MGYDGSSRGMGGFFWVFVTDCIYEPSDRIRHCGIAYEPWASSSRMGFGLNLYCITYGQDMAATLRELFRYLGKKGKRRQRRFLLQIDLCVCGVCIAEHSIGGKENGEDILK